MSFTETARVLQWLQSTLAGDATLAALVPGGCHLDFAPQKSAAPYLIYQFHAGHDVLGNGGKRFLTDALYDVKVVGKINNYTALASASDRVDTLINRQSGNAGTDGRVLACVREQPFVYRELVPNGQIWVHLGGVYRIWAQALSGLAQ